MRILFNNVMQGIALFDEVHSKGKAADFYDPMAFVEAFHGFAPDIVCMAEVPLASPRGDSPFLDALKEKLGLPYSEAALVGESWLLSGMWYGTALLSRWPVRDHRIVPLTNPSLETTWHDGRTMKMHDKHVQTCVIEAPEGAFNLANLHNFPFHKFRQSFKDHAHVKEELTELLTPKELPLIATGDFNNKDTPLEAVLPDLFHKRGLRNLVRFSMDDFFPNECKGQIDYILASRHFRARTTIVDRGLSDHPILLAEVERV